MDLHKLDHNKNQNICKNKLKPAFLPHPPPPPPPPPPRLREMYLPQKNQILVPGYLVPLSVYYILSNDQAVSHTHTLAENACT